jgi:pimeloyl-ACP methyl ester carboxylesterase
MNRNTQNRRRFLKNTSLTLAAIPFGVTGRPGTSSPAAPKSATYLTNPRNGGAIGPVKQIDAGPLNVGYVDEGPANGPVVLLLHGWPYDIHSYSEVAPLLTAKGYRVIIPFHRACGTTKFLSDQTIRNGQPAALAQDVIDQMDALKIGKAVVGGFDWGGRTANIIAALFPDRCKAMVSVSGYLISTVAANKQPLPPPAEYQWWYQYYFATERGAIGYDRYRHEFGKLIWRTASPRWAFSDETFERTAAAFDNPDYAAVVIHNYRFRLGLATGEPKYATLQARVEELPGIAVPTITLEGDANGAPHYPDDSAYRNRFTGKYANRVISGGIGHNLPQEAPAAFAQAVLDVDRF